LLHYVANQLRDVYAKEGVPKLASMDDWHEISALPEPLQTEAAGDELRVRMPEGATATFLLVFVPSLTRRTAVDVLEQANDPSAKRRILISYRQASAEARDALRAAGVSFAGADGRIFLSAPGILVERDDRPRPAKLAEFTAAEETTTRNPFAKRSSRIPRWLLLNHERPFFLGELAKAVDLNSAAASRVVRALEDAAFVRETQPDAGGRRRNVHLVRPRALLDAWLPHWQRRRIRHRRWDIGARDISEAFSILRETGAQQPGSWAIGSIAGATLARRAVEPADVLLWTIADEVEALAHALQPEPTRGGRGTIRVAIAPDPWTLGLSQPVDGLPVADPVQLWLDCSSEGERALEAADAVAAVTGWS
jgi:hypothetical protein